MLASYPGARLGACLQTPKMVASYYVLLSVVVKHVFRQTFIATPTPHQYKILGNFFIDIVSFLPNNKLM